MKKSTLPWYKEGLKFSCTGCGKCCTGFPGFVWVSDQEMKELAAYFKLSVEDFQEKYTRQLKGRVSLKEDPHTYACIFLQGKQCTIYPLRPKQCRTFPFWPQHLQSAEAWQKAAASCEGIDREGAWVNYETIQEQLDRQLKTES